jgi:hypothetical protein
MVQRSQGGPELKGCPAHVTLAVSSQRGFVCTPGLGYTEEELTKVSFEDLDPKAFQELVRKKMGAGSSNGSRQKVVGLDDVAGHLEQGWTVAMALNQNQAILNPPTFGSQ